MRLEDYERAPDIRGIHGVAAYHANFDHQWWIGQIKEMGMAWYKLIDDGSGSVFDFAYKLRQNGIMPIVRIFQNSPLPDRLPQQALDTIERYVGEKVTRWFEILNEPNLPMEWRGGQWEALGNQKPQKMVEIWLADAKEVIARGGYPAFPAMAPCGRMSDLGSILWYEWCFQIMAQGFAKEARSVFENGAWIATHDSPLNHCYKDDKGEWHFECPYDEIEQRDHPGLTILDGDASLIGHLVPVTLLKKYFQLEVPVISTESGVFVPKGGWAQWDPRYPGYDYNGHAERTVAMYRWLERYRVTRAWYFGMCPWLIANRLMGHEAEAWREDGWWNDLRGKLPVVDAVKAMGPPVANPKPLPSFGPSLPLEKTVKLAIRKDWRDPNSPIIEVKSIPMEDYLRGVLPQVMDPQVPIEALKAQAVAARSYAYYATAYPRHQEVGAHLCNSAHCQAWLPNATTKNTDEAIKQTQDMVAKYDNQVIRSYYFANCGGKTKNSENVWKEALPYCRSVACPVGGEPKGHGVGMCRDGAIELARQGKSYGQVLKHYYTGIVVEKVVIAPPPSPLPTPPPSPEPSKWRTKVEHRPGIRLIVGTFPRPGIAIVAHDPWGNTYTSKSGSKPEYGPGGFEILIFHDAKYRLTFLQETFEVEVKGDTVFLTFEEVETTEPQDYRVVSRWMTESEIKDLLARLSQAQKDRFKTEYK